MRGLVVKNTGSWYTVKTDDGRLVNCKVKGNFRLRGIRCHVNLIPLNPVPERNLAGATRQEAARCAGWQ